MIGLTFARGVKSQGSCFHKWAHSTNCCKGNSFEWPYLDQESVASGFLSDALV